MEFVEVSLIPTQLRRLHEKAYSAFAFVLFSERASESFTSFSIHNGRSVKFLEDMVYSLPMREYDVA
jgi:hypothetical protein